MSQHTVNSIFIRVVCGLLALYLFNISADIEDPNPAFVPEDLSFNDQESIIEIFVEKVLGYENAIEEYDDHDTEDQQKKKNVKVDVFLQVANSQAEENQTLIRKKNYPHFEAGLINGFIDIDSPPPKV
ncbi:MAG: hypothetical protein ACFHU9_05925 [Fluviicola sp.]